LEARNKGVSLDVNPKDPSLMAMANIEKLERVFTNLVGNAIRHCEEGDKISIDISKAGQQWLITVKDSGVGISVEDLPHIFEAHYRGRQSEAVKGDRVNSGLGLAITRRIIELHHSKIEVKSELGKGTLFSFSLNSIK